MATIEGIRKALGNRFPLARTIYRAGMTYSRTAVRHLEFSARDPKSTFRKIYLENLWGDPESRSGPGSGRAATEALRLTLPIILAELNIKSMLDAPCGDLAWMSAVPLPLERYIGVDLVPELVTDLQAKYRGQPREFLVKDLRSDSLPAVDLVFCRDCLIHLSQKDVFLALRNIRDSGSTYLMTTTSPDQPVNRDIITSWFRPINLQKPPFSFPPPRKLVIEQSARGNSPSRAMGLWLISELPL